MIPRDPGTFDERACRDADPEVFYPEKEDYGDARRVIKTYCAKCPVADICLQWANAKEDGLSAGNRYGIYGGLTPRERSQLSKRKEEAA